MPILGIVLTLKSESPAEGRAVLERLETIPHLELGARQGAKQPAVLECKDDSVDMDVGESNDRVEAEIEKLREIEGVLHVDVVFAEFADLLPDEDAASPNPTDERMSRPGEPRIEMEPESWS
jgi:nitrate reductase NapAB chaperone NapD